MSARFAGAFPIPPALVKFGYVEPNADRDVVYIDTIRPRTTVLNERVVWEKTRVLVLQAELMRQQPGQSNGRR